MPKISPDSAGLTARIEVIDPVEDPATYGGPDLIEDILNTDRIEEAKPPVDRDWVESTRVLPKGEQVIIPGRLRDWIHHRDHFKVLDNGTADVDVPFLAAAAPDLDEVIVTAKEDASKSTGGELSLKVAGNGLGASAKVSIADGYELTCARNETQVAYFVVRVAWELRSKPDNEDYNWVHTEVLRGQTEAPINVRRNPVPSDATVLQTVRITNQAGGTKPFGAHRSYAIAGGVDFTFGAKFDPIGLESTLKISTESSFEAKLDASLPSGHAYNVAWLAGPWGVSVTTAPN